MDENMPIRGLLVRPKAARGLWLAIATNCHRIVVSPDLAAKYWERLRVARPKTTPESATSMAALMNGILTNAEKTVWLESHPRPDREHLVRDQDDWFIEDLVRNAIESGATDECIVVTVDIPTRKDLQREEFVSMGATAPTVERAAEIATEEC